MLAGDLHEFSVAEVLRLLAASSKSGMLHVDTPEHDARVELREGRIRQATTDVSRAGLARRLLGSGLVTGETLELLLGDADRLVSDLELAEMLVTGDHLGSGQVAASLREQTISAVCTLQEQRGGTFTFAPGVVDPARAAAVAIAVPEVLTVVSERTAALPRLRQRTGALGAVVTIVGPALPDADGPEDAWQLLPLIDGRRSVGELSSLWGRGEYETRTVLAHLLEAGVVDVEAAEQARVGRLLTAREHLSRLEDGLAGGPDTDASLAAGVAPDTSTRTQPDAAAASGVIDLTERRTAARMAIEPTMDVATVRRLLAGVEALA